MDGSGCCQISRLRAAPAPKPLSVDIVFGLRSFVITVVTSQNLLLIHHNLHLQVGR